MNSELYTLCFHKRLTSGQSLFRVKKSFKFVTSLCQIVNYEEKGRGIQAMRDFSKGDFIVEYAGDLVELSEAKSREEIYKKDTSYGCYMYFFNHKGKSYWYVTLITSYLFFIL